ncbi:MAG: transposase, partial [Clostridia bacterium]
NHFEGVRIDKYVIMPNHVHAIIVIGCGDNVGLYKSGVSKRIHEIRPNIIIWQKSFNDRIIRNEQGYHEAWKYIDENPSKREI